MAPTINKNTDLTKLNEYFLGKGLIELIDLPPKEGTPLGDIKLMSHWIPSNHKIKFNVECKTEGICPICEMLKPTKWQRIKSWKLLKHFWLKMALLIALMVLCLGIWTY